MLPRVLDELDLTGATFYRPAIQSLMEAGVPFLVGGAYALEVHTGIVRRTKDFDIFVLPADVPSALSAFSRAGYQTEIAFPHWLGKAFCGDHFIDIIYNSGNGVCPVDDEWFEYAVDGRVLGLDLKLNPAGYQTKIAFPHWLAKAFCGDHFIDIIYNSGNGVCPVDEEWFDHAVDGRVLGLDLKLNPAEEAIWQKAFILERDRCDVADVAHLIRHRGPTLDWQRLLRRFGERWRVLLAQLTLFEFIYPGHRDVIPDWVMNDLMERLRYDPRPGEGGSLACHGTLLSATQYLHDVDLEGYRDGRLKPLGTMSREDIAVWTANFMKPK
jgi:hypothetical protein